MKILFIIQGEGRGHLTQALSLRQKLTDEGHQIVGVLVGKSPARIKFWTGCPPGFGGRAAERKNFRLQLGAKCGIL